MIKDVAYNKKTGNDGLLDLYLPDSGTPCPLLIYFHGGGIENGDKISGESDSLQRLTDSGIAFASVNYRMYPNAKFPEFIEDCAKAVAFLTDKGFSYGSFTNFFIGGSSAGSYLTSMLCFDKHYLAAYGIDSHQINGYIFDAGQPTVHFNVLRERGLNPSLVRIDDASPLYFVTTHISESEKTPSMLFFTAEYDMPGRFEQNRLFIRTLELFGYKNIEFKLMKGYEHCGYINVSDENGIDVHFETIKSFIRNNITT